MSTTYTYNIESTFPQGLNTSVLQRDISNNLPTFVGISLSETEVFITFSAALSAGEQSTLNTIIINHDPYSEVFDKYVIFAHLLPSSTNGGHFPSGSWVKRQLNVIQGQNTSTWVSLSNGQITLAAKNYVMGANCSVGNVGIHQLRFININTGSTIYGSTNQGYSAIIQGSFTVPIGGGVYELQHRCTLGDISTGTGFGTAAGFGSPEIYTTMRITQASISNP